MGNSSNYRAKAAEFLQKALRSTDSELAASYRQLTAGYECLADWAERVGRRKLDPKVATVGQIGSPREAGSPLRPPSTPA